MRLRRSVVSKLHFMLALPRALLRLTGACSAQPLCAVSLLRTCHEMCLLLRAGVSVSLVGVVHKSFPATMVMVILAGIFLEVSFKAQDPITTSHSNSCPPPGQ